MEIPKRLKKPEFRFVLIRKKSKRPFEKNWTVNNYKHTDKGLQKHIKNGGNYGVIGGFGNLIVIDFDNTKFQKKFASRLPKTFTVQTGSGMLHKYFYCDDTTSFKITDDKDDVLADIQGEGKQVVGPGSTHPSGNKYEVYDDSEIATISKKGLERLFADYLKPQKEKNLGSNSDRNLVKEIKKEIDLIELMDDFHYDTNRNPTMCKLGHGSKNQQCFTYNTSKDLWHCFHCNKGGDIFNFIQEHKGVGFKEALGILRKKAGIEDEYKVKEKENAQDTTISRMDIISTLVGGEKREAEEKIVNAIMKNNNIYTTRDDRKEEVWIYRKGIYVPSGETYIREFSRKLLGKMFTRYMINNIINKIKADTYIDPDKFFDNDCKHIVPVKNGLLNLKTRELEDFTPNKIFFNKLQVEYDPKAKCPVIEQHLKDVLKTEDDIKVFYELVGFCMYKEYFIEKAVMFVGGGRNGKGKTIDLIKRFLGIDNTTSVALENLESNSFQLSNLFGKMVNLAGDLSPTSLKKTGMFKQTVGRDLISAKRKFLSDVKFVNYAKHIFACNELPKVYDKTKGFWSKWILFEFPYEFIDEEEYNKLDKEERRMKKIKNVDQIHKISKQKELNGLLNKALDGLDRLLKNKKFSYSRGTKDIKNFWVRKSDSFMAFCLDNLEEGYESTISKKNLRKAYYKYCKDHEVKGASNRSIKVTLEEMFGVTDSQDHQTGERCWVGVRFKDNADYKFVDGRLKTNQKDEILEFIKEMNNGSGVSKNIIISAFKSKKSEEKISEKLDYFCENGLTYENRPGFYQILE